MSMSTISVSKMSDGDLHRMGVGELIRQLRRCDRDRLQSLADHSRLMTDVNSRLQTHILEIRGLKQVNRKLMEENQELRDLCCFQDDEGERSRKLAQEWQKFGHYTSDVMKSEVAAYHRKLGELEARQDELVRENFELKELCIYLDQDRWVMNFVLWTSSNRVLFWLEFLESLLNYCYCTVPVS